MDIKRRMILVRQIPLKPLWWQYELAAMNVRRVLECLAMVSFVAHEPYVERVSKTLLSKTANDIQHTLKAWNPAYFPQAVVVDALPDRLGMRDSDAPRLAEKEWSSAYGLCSRIVHTVNPLKPAIPKSELDRLGPLTDKLAGLTDQFVIELAHTGRVILCATYMDDDGRPPRATLFARTPNTKP